MNRLRLRKFLAALSLLATASLLATHGFAGGACYDDDHHHHDYYSGA